MFLQNNAVTVVPQSEFYFGVSTVCCSDGIHFDPGNCSNDFCLRSTREGKRALFQTYLMSAYLFKRQSIVSQAF